MIPTLYKRKLPKALTWPVGAEAVTAGLAGAPHAAELSLAFLDSPVLWASEFQRLLRDGLPYVVLVAEYHPADKPGYVGSNAMVERGEFNSRWEVRVSPVPRPLRSTAAALIRDHGLPAVADWLRSSGRAGWDGRVHRIELIFSPADLTLSQRFFDGV